MKRTALCRPSLSICISPISSIDTIYSWHSFPVAQRPSRPYRHEKGPIGPLKHAWRSTTTLLLRSQLRLICTPLSMRAPKAPEVIYENLKSQEHASKAHMTKSVSPIIGKLSPKFKFSRQNKINFWPGNCVLVLRNSTFFVLARTTEKPRIQRRWRRPRSRLLKKKRDLKKVWI